MRLLSLGLSAALFSLVLAGCASNDLVVKRQTESEAKLEHLFQLSGEFGTRLNEISARLASLEEKETGRVAKISELQDTVRGLKDAQVAISAQIADKNVATTPKVELVNPETPGRTRESGPPPLYLKAFGLYSSNSFSAAIELFEQFLKENPASEYIPNAHYWIGECHYSNSDISRALVSFQRVVDGWPRHPKASDALLKIGYSHIAMKQSDKGKQVFERLIRSYPGSPAAIKARERLMLFDSPAR